MFVGDDWFDTLNFVAFNPLQNNNPIAVRRRKLVAKIDAQLAANRLHMAFTDEHGNQRKLELDVLSVGGLLVLMERYCF